MVSAAAAHAGHPPFTVMRPPVDLGFQCSCADPGGEEVVEAEALVELGATSPGSASASDIADWQAGISCKVPMPKRASSAA
jgi:hypothetical protein